MNDTDSHIRTACSHLADYLQSHQEKLLNDWVMGVREDSGVPAESMTKPEIIDHVPNILEAINVALRQQCGMPTRAQEAVARHTIVRWVQGFDLHAVLREISLLRTVFIRYSRTFEDHDQHLRRDGLLFATTIIHRILDDIVLGTADTFLKLKAHANGDEI
jgi:hypothetical protein